MICLTVALVHCRGNSSEMQGSATDDGPDPGAKKIKVHMDADVEDASHGHTLTEAERRRVRRSVQAICASVHPAWFGQLRTNAQMHPHEL